MDKSQDIEWDVISKQEIKREKEKCRRLRQSSWWMRKTQQGVCYYCNRKVEKSDLTMDHLVPLSRGGKSTKGNIVPACKECNNKKKYLLPIEWEDYLKSLAERSPSS
jgi:5-methylcytosine-specific restriction endonuclease McrA